MNELPEYVKREYCKSYICLLENQNRDNQENNKKFKYWIPLVLFYKRKRKYWGEPHTNGICAV